MASSRGDSIHRSGARNSWSTLVWLVCLPVLTACGTNPGVETSSLPNVPAQPAAATRPAPNSAQSPQPAAGFTPLPTPQQVIGAVGSGRVDPFAPLPPSTGEAPPVLPEGLRFNGVILASGQPRALVQFQGNTGALSVGDQGGRTTDLLPPTWRVAAVDLAQGRLVLATGSTPASTKITLEL